MRSTVWMCFAVNNYSAHAYLKPRACVKNGRSLPWAVREWFKYENKLGDRMIKQLLNSVIAKYRDLSVSRRTIICLSPRVRQIIDLLATDKSRYFAQLRPIIVNYSYSLKVRFVRDYQLPGLTTGARKPIRYYCFWKKPNLFLWRVLICTHVFKCFTEHVSASHINCTLYIAPASKSRLTLFFALI